MECLFCSIVAKDVPATIVYEDDVAMVFEDIHPKAPIHLLVIPKRHISSLATTSDEDVPLLGHLLRVLSKVAAEKDLSGYKTMINTGRDGGQIIDHLHLHLLGGKKWKE